MPPPNDHAPTTDLSHDDEIIELTDIVAPEMPANVFAADESIAFGAELDDLLESLADSPYAIKETTQLEPTMAAEMPFMAAVSDIIPTATREPEAVDDADIALDALFSELTQDAAEYTLNDKDTMSTTIDGLFDAPALEIAPLAAKSIVIPDNTIEKNISPSDSSATTEIAPEYTAFTSIFPEEAQVETRAVRMTDTSAETDSEAGTLDSFLEQMNFDNVSIGPIVPADTTAAIKSEQIKEKEHGASSISVSDHTALVEQLRTLESNFLQLEARLESLTTTDLFSRATEAARQESEQMFATFKASMPSAAAVEKEQESKLSQLALDTVQSILPKTLAQALIQPLASVTGRVETVQQELQDEKAELIKQVAALRTEGKDSTSRFTTVLHKLDETQEQRFADLQERENKHASRLAQFEVQHTSKLVKLENQYSEKIARLEGEATSRLTMLEEKLTRGLGEAKQNASAELRTAQKTLTHDFLPLFFREQFALQIVQWMENNGLQFFTKHFDAKMASFEQKISLMEQEMAAQIHNIKQQGAALEFQFEEIELSLRNKADATRQELATTFEAYMKQHIIPLKEMESRVQPQLNSFNEALAKTVTSGLHPMRQQIHELQNWAKAAQERMISFAQAGEELKKVSTDVFKKRDYNELKASLTVELSGYVTAAALEGIQSMVDKAAATAATKIIREELHKIMRS